MTNQPVTPVTDDTLPVTLVTKDASVDFSDEQYREVLLLLWEGKAQRSYPELLKMLEEPISRKAWWHHRVTGNRTTFGPDERNKVRAAWWKHRDANKQAQLALTNHNALAIADVPLVNPSVTAVTQRIVHPDAAVHTIGDVTDDEQSRLMLIIAPIDGHIEIHVNGTINARMVAESPQSAVTPVISSVAATCNETPTQTRAPRSGVSVTRATDAQNEQRKALGVSWADVIEAGLKALAQ